MQVMLESHVNGEACLALAISTQALPLGLLAVEFGGLYQCMFEYGH